MSKDDKSVARVRRILLDGLATAAALALLVALIAGIGYLNREYQSAVAPYARIGGLALGLVAAAFVVLTRADFLAVFAPTTTRPKLVVLASAVGLIVGSQILVFWLLETLALLKDVSTSFLSRSPIAVAASLLVAGVALLAIRSFFRFSYGLGEAATGVAVGWKTAALPHMDALIPDLRRALELGEQLLTLGIVTSSLFLIVRGLDNAWLGVRGEQRSLEVRLVLRLLGRPTQADGQAALSAVFDVVEMTLKRVEALEQRPTLSEDGQQSLHRA